MSTNPVVSSVIIPTIKAFGRFVERSVANMVSLKRDALPIAKEVKSFLEEIKASVEADPEVQRINSSLFALDKEDDRLTDELAGIFGKKKDSEEQDQASAN